MSKMRQVIAQRLTQSVVTAPHFYVTVEADVSDLIELRAQLKKNGAPYTITDFVSLAAVDLHRQRHLVGNDQAAFLP